MNTFRRFDSNSACGYRQFVRLAQVLVLLLAVTGCGGGGTLPSSTPTPTSPQSFSLVVDISGNGTVTSSPASPTFANSCRFRALMEAEIRGKQG